MLRAKRWTEEEKELLEKSEDYVQGFERAMDDDFNTADAIASIFELVKFINTTADGSRTKEYLDSLYEKTFPSYGCTGNYYRKERRNAGWRD